ncbi:hypothetical protein [Egbenema bharatensis]|uniref:hypothetical protein n=1 Tax=Egbenema bharatensis TaxID=3463334 RepID=UPI003A884082
MSVLQRLNREEKFIQDAAFALSKVIIRSLQRETPHAIERNLLTWDSLYHPHFVQTILLGCVTYDFLPLPTGEDEFDYDYFPARHDTPKVVEVPKKLVPLIQSRALMNLGYDLSQSQDLMSSSKQIPLPWRSAKINPHYERMLKHFSLENYSLKVPIA